MMAATKRMLVAVASLAFLSSCATSGGGNTAASTGGGLLGGGSGNKSAVYITALQGGIVARSGVQLSSSDRQRALEAEYRALEAAAGGQPVTWGGTSVGGEVIAAAPFQVGAQNCRQYKHKLTVSGRPAEARGAACRNADGTWTPLT